MAEEGVVKEGEGTSTLPGAGCQDGPRPFAPAHAVIAASSLRDTSIAHDVADYDSRPDAVQWPPV
jgi:hypothetical protein